jgi:hypothetical protein
MVLNAFGQAYTYPSFSRELQESKCFENYYRRSLTTNKSNDFWSDALLYSGVASGITGTAYSLSNHYDYTNIGGAAGSSSGTPKAEIALGLYAASAALIGGSYLLRKNDDGYHAIRLLESIRGYGHFTTKKYLKKLRKKTGRLELTKEQVIKALEYGLLANGGFLCSFKKVDKKTNKVVMDFQRSKEIKSYLTQFLSDDDLFEDIMSYDHYEATTREQDINNSLREGEGESNLSQEGHEGSGSKR